MQFSIQEEVVVVVVVVGLLYHSVVIAQFVLIVRCGQSHTAS